MVLQGLTVSQHRYFSVCNWKEPTPFYYLTLCISALCYWFTLHLARTPFGLALQGVRDNPRRMAAMGYNVNAHRLAAYAIAGIISGIAGVLLVWSTGQISPNTGSIGPIIDILVITVIGGINRPIGPFVGALIYVILRTYSLDFLNAVGLDGERFKLVIGITFLVIVYFLTRWNVEFGTVISSDCGNLCNWRNTMAEAIPVRDVGTIRTRIK